VKEITVDIRFISPCLGATRDPDDEGPVRFDKVGGDVMFPPSAWRKVLEKAAAGIGMPTAFVADIRIDPRVYRKPGTYRRYYTQDEYTIHEAYLPGECISLCVLLPDNVSEDLLLRLLDNVGRFWGMSPYGWKRHGFGRFEILSPIQES